MRDFGQQAGDALFVHLTTVLQSVTRATDVVARWSQSRLVVVTHGAGAPMDVLSERVVRALPRDCPVPETA
jgi:GGDEF domain-containing protein